MRTEADLRGAAAAHGLSVTALERVPMPGDPSSTTLATRMTFDDPWAAARLLYELAQEDAADPVVRAWALDLQAAASRWLGEPIGSPTRSSALVDELARTIHGNVQEQILFIHEPKETFQSARVTMATQAGDCDDHARLVYALARAAGLKAKLIFLEDDAQPVHVVAQIEDSRGYQWAETTIDAAYGEPPLQAYARLKKDVARGLAADPFQQGGAANGLGFLGLDFVTPQDVRDRKGELNAAVETLDADLVKCTALDASTLDGWNQFVAEWRTFAADDPGFFSAGSQGRQAAEYAERIREWQERAGEAGCTLSSPKLPLAKDDPIVGTVKVVAISAAVLGVAYVAVQGLAFLPRRKKNPRRRRR